MEHLQELNIKLQKIRQEIEKMDKSKDILPDNERYSWRWAIQGPEAAAGKDQEDNEIWWGCAGKKIITIFSLYPTNN